MLKNILSIGKSLNKTEQKQISGGGKGSLPPGGCPSPFEWDPRKQCCFLSGSGCY